MQRRFGKEHSVQMYANTKSLQANMEELECLVLNEDLDKVGITDTWWNGGKNSGIQLSLGILRKEKGRKG